MMILGVDPGLRKDPRPPAAGGAALCYFSPKTLSGLCDVLSWVEWTTFGELVQAIETTRKQLLYWASMRWEEMYVQCEQPFTQGRGAQSGTKLTECNGAWKGGLWSVPGVLVCRDIWPGTWKARIDARTNDEVVNYVNTRADWKGGPQPYRGGEANVHQAVALAICRWLLFQEGMDFEVNGAKPKPKRRSKRVEKK